MTPQVTSPRHPWELLFAQLSGRLGVLVDFGTEDDAKAPPFDRICFIPGVPTFEPCPFDLPGCRVVELAVLRCDVPIYGGSFLACWQRTKDLDGWFFNICGRRQGTAGNPDSTPPVAPQAGYDFRAKGKPTTGGDLGASTWCLELEVTLKDFVLSEVRPSLLVTHPGFVVTALAGNGVGPDALPTWQS